MSFFTEMPTNPFSWPLYPLEGQYDTINESEASEVSAHFQIESPVVDLRQSDSSMVAEILVRLKEENSEIESKKRMRKEDDEVDGDQPKLKKARLIAPMGIKEEEDYTFVAKPEEASIFPTTKNQLLMQEIQKRWLPEDYQPPELPLSPLDSDEKFKFSEEIDKIIVYLMNQLNYAEEMDRKGSFAEGWDIIAQNIGLPANSGWKKRVLAHVSTVLFFEKTRPLEDKEFRYLKQLVQREDKEEKGIPWAKISKIMADQFDYKFSPNNLKNSWWGRAKKKSV